MSLVPVLLPFSELAGPCEKMMKKWFSPSRWGRTRLWTLLSLLAVTPLGFALKLYTGPGRAWANNYAAGVLYEIFWCLLLFLIRPRRPILSPSKDAGRIALVVLIATCILEFLQLWHPAPLEAIRATFLGRTLLGTTFSWWDFPHYLLGCGLGWLWMARLARAGEVPNSPVRPE